MKKKILCFYSLLLLSLSVAFVACDKGNVADDQGSAYQVVGTLELDSTVVLDNLVLYADNHSSLRVDTLQLNEQHQFTSQFKTAGFDELYLCSDGGELCRFYATEGMEVRFKLTMGEKGIEAAFEQTETDSINPWLRQHGGELEGKGRMAVWKVLDALNDTTIRNTLLIRKCLFEIDDSLRVRRYLGGLPASAKPEWLTKSIDLLLDEQSTYMNGSRRMAPASFEVKDDSVLYNTGASRSEYLLVYFWADYSMPSLDSLKMLAKLVKEDYGEKRLQMLTCCLNASDSTWWKLRTLNMGGRHTWIQGGMADPRITDWGVREVPYVMLLDMYNNRQLRNEWGDKLRKTLDRLPKKAPSI